MKVALICLLVCGGLKVGKGERRGLFLCREDGDFRATTILGKERGSSKQGLWLR